ncbi:MAG: GerMN domain-containing protein [Clostridiales bacterium]|nr:GerMN domain-containing protein [Clostridiales bacterium]MCF8021325.1 GerMN domain-containing protein [Clostridiales bacterium]
MHPFIQKNIYIIFILLFTFSAIIFGCTEQDKGQDNKDQPNVQNKEETQKMRLAAYYLKYTQDDAYLVREMHEIVQTDNPLQAAVEELIKTQPYTEGCVNIFPDNTQVLDVKVKNAMVTVDFSSNVLNANVGSQGEILGIQSIVNTLTEFPDVEAVSFQVEGKVDNIVQDWWGHVGLYNQPFKRDLSKVYKPAIWVTHPQPEQVIGIPMLVKGSARVFEGNVNTRLVDSNGNIIAKKSTTAEQGAPERGDFETSIKFEPPETKKGRLEVFSTSAKDGSEQNKVTIPVIFSK